MLTAPAGMERRDVSLDVYPKPLMIVAYTCVSDSVTGKLA